MLNALLITYEFYKKEKLLENEKDLAKQKFSSKPAKASETTETVEAAVQKSLTQNRQNIPRFSRHNEKKQNSQSEPFNKDHVSKRTWKDQSISST